MSYPTSSDWIPIIKATDINEGDVTKVIVHGTALAVYRIKGKCFVTSDICTHGQASLSDGYLDGDTIECPLHQGLFHVPTGKAIGAPATEPIKTYEAKFDNGKVCIRFNT